MVVTPSPAERLRRSACRLSDDEEVEDLSVLLTEAVRQGRIQLGLESAH